MIVAIVAALVVTDVVLILALAYVYYDVVIKVEGRLLAQVVRVNSDLTNFVVQQVNAASCDLFTRLRAEQDEQRRILNVQHNTLHDITRALEEHGWIADVTALPVAMPSLAPHPDDTHGDTEMDGSVLPFPQPSQPKE